MYDVKKKMPLPEEDVLVVLDLIGGHEVCEGFITEDGHWYIHKYGGRHNFGGWKVLGWMPMPEEDDFLKRFLSFALGYASGVVLALALMFLVG